MIRVHLSGLARWVMGTIVALGCQGLDDRSLAAPIADASTDVGQGGVPGVGGTSSGAGTSGQVVGPTAVGAPPPLIMPGGAGASGAPGAGDAGPAAAQVRPLDVDADAVAFGSAVIGQSVPAQVTLTNSGSLPLSITVTLGGEDAGDFIIVPGGCTSALAAGSSCTLSLQLSPSVAGLRAAQLTVLGSDGTSITVALSGQGADPGVLTSETSGFDFGAREVGTPSDTLTWVVTNVGGSPVNGVAFDNSNPSEFVATNGCTGALGPGSSCTVTTSFLPREGGPRLARLTVSDANLASVGLSLIGTGQYRLTVTNAGAGQGRVSSATPGIDCPGTCSALFVPGPVRLTARTANGAQSRFAGWSLPACAGVDRQCDVQLGSSATVGANFATFSNNLIFITSQTFPATLGGIARYDSECNRLATAAGINDSAGNAYIAVMSDAAVSFRNRLPASARGWVRLDGRPFADRQVDLFGSTGGVLHGAAYDELGHSAPDALGWSGTFADGTSYVSTCASWTQASQDYVGLASPSNGPEWIISFADTCASGPWSVMCMGTTRTAALPPLQTFTGKRIWVTNTTYLPGTGTPDQKCQSERPAGVAQGVALVSTSSRAAADRLLLDTNYVRPDGQLVGTGRQIADLQMLAGPWQRANGSAAPIQPNYVWAGSYTPTDRATPDSSCNDWQDPNGFGIGGLFGFSHYRAWTYIVGWGCNLGASLYCIEP